jgi:hypothetical protein
LGWKWGWRGKTKPIGAAGTAAELMTDWGLLMIWDSRLRGPRRRQLGSDLRQTNPISAFSGPKTGVRLQNKANLFELTRSIRVFSRQ